MSRRVARVVAVVAVVALVAVACGGGSDDDGSVADREGAVGSGDATSSDNGQVTPEEAAEVPASLEFVGDLAVVYAGPVTERFDASAGSLALADGASLDVPAGAFGALTEVTATIVDLAFGQYFENPPEARLYVLATVDDVELAEPVVLDVPKPSDSVRVTRLVDGEWEEVSVPVGDTTRVPIEHFSEIVVAVADVGGPEPEPIGPAPDFSPRQFLQDCVYTVMYATYGGVGPVATDFAWGACTRALVTKLTPAGQKVEVSCVGDQISRDADLGIRQAIDACLPERDDTDETASDDSTSDGVAPDTHQTAVDADEVADGSATHTFSAVLDYSEGDGEVYYEWSGAFRFADDGGIIGSGAVVGRTAGTCGVSGVGGTSAEYGTYGEGRFDLVGRTAGDGLEISFANVTGDLTTLEGDESQACVDISFDTARALLWLPLGGEALGGPIVVPVTGGSVSIEPPEWGIAIEVEVVRL